MVLTVIRDFYQAFIRMYLSALVVDCPNGTTNPLHGIDPSSHQTGAEDDSPASFDLWYKRVGP